MADKTQAKTDFKNTPIAVPDEAVLHSFHQTVTPMFEMIIANKSENKRLLELRDQLIPQLMSGNIDVSSVEI